MPIRRILGQSATAAEPTPEAVVHEITDDNVASDSATIDPAAEEPPAFPTRKIHSKLVNHLKNYQGFGQIIEGPGEYIAPTVLLIKNYNPESVVSFVKSVDSFLENGLISVDSVVPDFLKREPQI